MLSVWGIKKEDKENQAQSYDVSLFHLLGFNSGIHSIIKVCEHQDSKLLLE